VVLAGDMVCEGTTLVTPALTQQHEKGRMEKGASPWLSAVPRKAIGCVHG